MGRFARSWDLTKTSFKVIRQDRELLWMPVLSGLASLTAVLAIAGIGLGSGVWPQTQTADGATNYAGAALAFALYIALAFVSLFFHAAVVAAANERLGGGDPTVGSALRAAWSKAGKIFLWAIIVATVNVILQAIRERSGAVGQILSSLAGTAWNLATFFMVPVLLFDDKGIGSSLKRSGGLFKQTWGETVINQVGLSLADFAVGIAVTLVGVLLLFLLAPLGIVGIVAAVVLIALAIIGTVALFSVLGGVYKAALYRYATTQQVAPGFKADQVGGAFAPR